MKPHYSESEMRVIEAIQKNPGVNVGTLMGLTGASRPTVRNAIIKAQASNRLKVTDTWPRLYTWNDDEQTSIVGLTPDRVATKDIAPVFEKARPRLIKALESIDFKKQDQQQIMSTLARLSEATLGLYDALSRVEEGPEWRQEVGA